MKNLNNTHYLQILRSLIIRFSITRFLPSLAYLTVSRAIEKCDDRNSSDSMADPRASVKTVPRERLEGKTPRDAFALVGTLSRNSRRRFELVIITIGGSSENLSLSLSLSNDPCRNPSWTKSRIVYTPKSNVRSTIGKTTQSFEISPFGL